MDSLNQGVVLKNGFQNKQPASAVTTDIILDSDNCSFFPDIVAVMVARNWFEQL